MEKELKDNNKIKLRTWWLLCKTATTGSDWKDILNQFDDRIKTVKHHPPEKINFEKLCRELLRWWIEGQQHDRSNFALNAMESLDAEFRNLRGLNIPLRDSDDLKEIIQTVMSEMKADSSTLEATKLDLREKVSNIAVEGAGKIVIDTILAGILRVLGLTGTT